MKTETVRHVAHQYLCCGCGLHPPGITCERCPPAGRKPDWSAVIPIRTVNELNRSRYENPFAKSRRAKAQQKAVGYFWVGGPKWNGQHLTVTLTRLAPKTVDPSSLGACFKAVVDAVFVCLGLFKLDIRSRPIPLDHDESCVTIRFAQEEARRYGIRIHVRAT